MNEKKDKKTLDKNLPMRILMMESVRKEKDEKVVEVDEKSDGPGERSSGESILSGLL